MYVQSFIDIEKILQYIKLNEIVMIDEGNKKMSALKRMRPLAERSPSSSFCPTPF